MPYQYIDSDEDVAAAVIAGLRLERPASCPPFVWRLVEACWQPDAAYRPSFAALGAQLALVHALLGRGQALPAHSSPADVLSRARELSKRATRTTGSSDKALLASPALLAIAAESLDAQAQAVSVGSPIPPEMLLEHFQVRYQVAEDAAAAEVAAVGR